MLEVAERLARELDVDVEPEVRDSFRAGDVRHCIADIERARTLLGFEPRVDYGDGMRELAGWLADQQADDRVDEATAALVARGLAR